MSTIKESDDEGDQGLSPGQDLGKPLHSPLLPHSTETRGLRNIPTAISIAGNIPPRRRKASVMSNLSAHMDFTGSSLHITSEVRIQPKLTY